MKFKLSIPYFILGGVGVVAVSYFTFLQPTETVQNVSGSTNLVLELGSIQNSIEVVGDASLVDEQSLSFNQAGTITRVNFEAGDTVKKGDTIAEIDNSDAYDAIEEAKISLENAQISLSQLYEGIDESKRIQAENSIVTAENSLKNSKIELENLKVSQQNSVSKLLSDIETLKKEKELLIKQQENSFSNTDVNKNATVTSIEDSFKNNLLDIEGTIEEMDYILGVTIENESKNDSYEDYLGAKDVKTKDLANASLLKTISSYNAIQTLYKNYDYSGEKEKLLPILNAFIEIYNLIYNTSDLIYNTAEQSIESSGILSQSDIDSIKNNMTPNKSNALSKITSLKNSINTLSTLTNTELLGESNTVTIEKQTSSIENAMKNYDETIASHALILASKQQDISAKEVAVSVAKLSLEELLEGPTVDNVTKANNTIKQANIKLEAAYEKLEDYILQAPFDGVVRKIDYMVGDNLTNDTNKYVYIENPNLLEISVMLDQIDVITVQLGQDALIIFDTYATTPVKAKISSIDTTPVQSSGVISYEVKLILDDSEFDEKILSGMTANVEIITESKEDIVVVKTSAISEKNGKKYLTIQKQGQETEVEIETGISSSGMTEIISGASQGDIVVVKEFVSTAGKTEAASTTLFSAPTTTGGPGGRTR